jgi:hypothetical protein
LKEGDKAQKMVLPRLQPCVNLHVREYPESVWQTTLNAHQSMLANPDVLGVYETQVPLIFRAILELGSVCTVQPNAREKIGSNQPLNLSDLAIKSERITYLKNGSELNKVFIYHSFTDSRGIVGLFFFGTKKAKVYVIQPFSQADKPKLNFDKMIEEAQNQLSQANPGEAVAASRPAGWSDAGLNDRQLGRSSTLKGYDVCRSARAPSISLIAAWARTSGAVPIPR